jgi:cyclohexanone monooxygenase
VHQLAVAPARRALDKGEDRMTHTTPPSSQGLSHDPAWIEEKYRQERDKRLRPDGATQYVAIEIGSELEADPFVDSAPERDPVTEEVDVVILGGGYSGLLSAVRLRQAGVDDFRIVEKGADFGGTWYWNRYPGVACDVESYIYLPLLEELGYIPTERYAAGAEILEHARTIAKHYSLYETALFQTRADDVRWEEESGRWVVRSHRGDELRGRYVIMGTGGLLHRPKLPGIAGLGTFEGKAFHTSRWDYGYTGGDSKGGLTGLRGKRVAVIGTGATALQVVPHVAECAEHLYVIQRTPTAVDIRGNAPTGPEWAASLEPGWQRRRMENFDSLLAGLPQDEDLVSDQWTQIWGIPQLEIPGDGSAPDMAAYMQRVQENDHRQMERIRARVDELVNDPQTAEALKPWFGTHCKRPGFHDSYLQTFNRPNVTLVDTKGRGADRISAHAVHFDGRAYEVDCIIYATGFEAAVSPGRAGAFAIKGRDAITLEERWAEGVRTLHGIYVHGFPNLFIVGGIRQAAVSINVLFMNDEQAKHVAAVIADLLRREVRSVEITEAAEKQWAATMAEKSLYNEEATRACTPGFYNNEGNFKNGTPLFAAAYGGGPVEYIGVLAEWRRSGLEEHTIIDRAPSRA